jgi:hypothetical protein
MHAGDGAGVQGWIGGPPAAWLAAGKLTSLGLGIRFVGNLAAAVHRGAAAGSRPIHEAQIKVTKAKGLKATSDLTELGKRGPLLSHGCLGSRVQPVTALEC